MLTWDELHTALAEVLGEQAGADDNLIGLGMDSIRLMQLTGRLRRRGIEIRFAELAERPTLAGWWELLAEKGQVEATGGPPALDPADTEPDGDLNGTEPDGPFPLALMQHAYWIGRDSGQSLGSVAAHLYVELDGRAIDPARFEEAVRGLVARHPMLRAAVSDDGTQRILPDRPGPAVTVHDLRSSAEADAELEKVRAEMSEQRLPIEDGRVFDARLSLLPDGNARLHLDVDMIAADAMSYRVMLADLAALYEGETLAPIRYGYARYLADDPRAEARAADRRWWADRLAGLPGPPELPVVPEPGDRVERRHHWLPPDGKDRFIARAHAEGVTPAMALAAVFAEIVGAWSATPRFLLNLPMFHREPVHPDVDSVIGDFTGSIMLEADVSADLPFVGRARAVQANLHTAGAHSDYSGLEVLRDLSRLRGEQVLAPIVYTSALNLGELFGDRVRDSFGEPEWIISQGPQVLLDAQVTEVSGGLLLNWDVRRPAFPDGVAEAMFGAYTDAITRLGAPGADWNAPLGIAAPPSQLPVRDRLNATPAPPPRTLTEGFFEHARNRPDAPALHWGDDGTMTYGELADRALRIAGALAADGVHPGDRVSVELPKGPEQAAAVLGVLAAGAAYVPIGREQPESRRERIRRSAGVAALLTPGLAFDAEPLAEPVAVRPDQVAYVLFTSGSTGEPKGVEVPHGAAMNTIGDLVERFAIGAGDTTFGVSALDFDLSVFDLFAAWYAGGAVVLPDEDERRDAARWSELVGRWSVTVLNCVPSVLEMLLHAGRAESLRLVLLGGDWVGTHLPGLLEERAPGCRFVALGGTTETAIHSTVQEVAGEVPSDWRAVPYGVPLRGVACRVVDELGRDRPDWVAGELWIGGAGVADGYVADPGRTADRFVVRDGTRWYRTGDLARYRPGGTLEFLGRRDHQVKVRGFRIELGEVEAALQDHPAVERAVALLAGGRLAAAVAAPAELDRDTVLARARDLVPPHMVPELLVRVGELPLTANGKVDRKALTALAAEEAGEAAAAHVEPETSLERVLARIVAEVLGEERVGADADFFALGGDSVLATTVLARLREALDTTALPVRVLFAERTVARICRRFTELAEAPGRLEAVAGIWLEVEAMTEEELTARLG
ncbi:amino acid adenylation domain-containing protein [Actinomadura darangshiensis]|uniref:Phenyloxazoline synthase MbtB n=1 Tax=Actinomadura darangshiensis TaxID=705336 RepID=A0A4R5B7P7_9ACTN|nr:non-ribosomal peptide synthetase [Actinomadura darangshiensis]TDD79302.1 amino acid adenylation domain-containing protein [Actinomadura darangshiensis]